jgi:hypothetical protein
MLYYKRNFRDDQSWFLILPQLLLQLHPHWSLRVYGMHLCSWVRATGFRAFIPFHNPIPIGAAEFKRAVRATVRIHASRFTLHASRHWPINHLLHPPSSSGISSHIRVHLGPSTPTVLPYIFNLRRFRALTSGELRFAHPRVPHTQFSASGALNRN